MLLTHQQLAEVARPDPAVTEYFAKNPPGPPATDPLAVRAMLLQWTSAMISAIGPAPEGQEESYQDIEMRDGYIHTIKTHKPSSGPPGPLIILVFGGGYMAGSADQPTKQARILVRLFGATVVNISYRLAPENKFPTGQLDAWDCTKWVAKNATGPMLNADPSKGFLIGGVSAGADISAALSRLSQKDELAHPLTGQWLGCPNVFNENYVPEKYKEHYKSWYEKHEGYNGVPVEEINMITKTAAWDPASELRYAGQSDAPLTSRHPKTFIQIAGMDPLRDDSLIYEEMLKEAGVKTKVDFYPGCPHAHWYLMRGVPLSEKGRIDCIAGIAWLLDSDMSREDIATATGSGPVSFG